MLYIFIVKVFDARSYVATVYMKPCHCLFIVNCYVNLFFNCVGESNTDLWGNYSIPRDNPYSKGKEAQPEIWAEGLRNPWRCSFDVERPSYFVCADTGQVQMILLLLSSSFLPLMCFFFYFITKH